MKKMKTGTIVLISIAVIVVILILAVIGMYNSLVTKSEKIEAALGNINADLQRRADLIPNLVSTAKAYAEHEEDIYKEITDARKRLIEADSLQEKAEANQEVTTVLEKLFAIAEDNPELKADANFRQLADELAGTENRIKTSRRDYNEAVRDYNTQIRRFPTSIVAGLFGFEKYEYFEAREGAEDAPDVGDLLGD